MSVKQFTEAELAQYDGNDGNPAYIAYKGKVYDVSSSFLWQDGMHQVYHGGGKDLTEALEEAPHGADVLARFPVVGVLQGARLSETPPYK